MKIVLEYRNPTPAHCDVVIFVNDALAGEIRLRQEELISFQMIICNGCHSTFDTFLSKGDPGRYT